MNTRPTLLALCLATLPTLAAADTLHSGSTGLVSFGAGEITADSYSEADVLHCDAEALAEPQTQLCLLNICFPSFFGSPCAGAAEYELLRLRSWNRARLHLFGHTHTVRQFARLRRKDGAFQKKVAVSVDGQWLLNNSPYGEVLVVAASATHTETFQVGGAEVPITAEASFIVSGYPVGGLGRSTASLMPGLVTDIVVDAAAGGPCPASAVKGTLTPLLVTTPVILSMSAVGDALSYGVQSDVRHVAMLEDLWLSGASCGLDEDYDLAVEPTAQSEMTVLAVSGEITASTPPDAAPAR